MTTRTLPSIFPLVRETELYSRRVLKGSLMRRLAQCQNWIWAKFIKVYGAHGYEGLGNTLQHIKSSLASTKDEDLVEAYNAELALPLASFYIPPNWGGSRRVVVQGRSNLAAANATTGEILIGIYTLDEVYIGVSQSVRITSTGDTDWSLTLDVPQDKSYQCKIFMQLNDGASTDEDSTADSITTTYISARYAVAVAAEIGGDAIQASWSPTDESLFVNGENVNSAILQRILRNTMHIYTQRPPELCQSWLGNCFNNTSTFVEVGRYKIWCPDMVTGVTGKLTVHPTHGGAGNEVRVKLDGTVVQTFTALSAAEATLDVTEFAVGDGAEHTITIEAKSTAASANYGTVVYGVSFWESSITQGVGSLSAVTSFQPLDEDGLQGDDEIAMIDNGQGQKSGLAYLILNDRWLARHRLRHLIGDWRHRIYKSGYKQTSTFIAPRVDWTPGITGLALPKGRPKNITLCALSDGDNDDDGVSKFDFGESETTVVLSPASVSYESDTTNHATPWPRVSEDDDSFEIPTVKLTFAHSGRRLAKHWVITPTSTSTIQASEKSWTAWARGRRLPARHDAYPIHFGVPTSSGGNLKPNPYEGSAWFATSLNAVSEDILNIHGRGALVPDIQRHWSGPNIGTHDAGASKDFQLWGRCPGIGAYTTYGPYAVTEGHYYEVELNSLYFADAPLTSEELRAL